LNYVFYVSHHLLKEIKIDTKKKWIPNSEKEVLPSENISGVSDM